MQLDLEYLRQHYAALSDEGLQAIDPADLVDAARTIFQSEVDRRKLVLGQQRGQSVFSGKADVPDEDAAFEEPEYAGEMPGDEEKPDWAEEAVEVISYAANPGVADHAVDARHALEAAGIPCYLDLCETPQEESVSPEPTHLWRLMVPSKLNLQATSVLDRLIHNPEFEAGWRTHLEALSDEELHAMTPEVVFPGLFDRVARVNRAYDEELLRRGMK
jgi:hypothetical protein